MAGDTEIIVESNRIPELKGLLLSAIDDAVQALARSGELHMKEGMRDTPKRNDGTSEGGNYPAIDSSALINSVNVKPVREMLWYLRWGTEYAAILEYGIPQRMAARPSGQLTTAWLRQHGPDIIRQYVDINLS